MTGIGATSCNTFVEYCGRLLHSPRQYVMSSIKTHQFPFLRYKVPHLSLRELIYFSCAQSPVLGPTFGAVPIDNDPGFSSMSETAMTHSAAGFAWPYPPE